MLPSDNAMIHSHHAHVLRIPVTVICHSGYERGRTGWKSEGRHSVCEGNSWGKDNTQNYWTDGGTVRGKREDSRWWVMWVTKRVGMDIRAIRDWMSVLSYSLLISPSADKSSERDNVWLKQHLRPYCGGNCFGFGLQVPSSGVYVCICVIWMLVW